MLNNLTEDILSPQIEYPLLQIKLIPIFHISCSDIHGKFYREHLRDILQHKNQWEGSWQPFELFCILSSLTEFKLLPTSFLAIRLSLFYFSLFIPILYGGRCLEAG